MYFLSIFLLLKVINHAILIFVQVSEYDIM